MLHIDLQTKRLASILAGGLLLAIPVLAQEGYRSEASVQAFGSWVKSTTDNGVQVRNGRRCP